MPKKPPLLAQLAGIGPGLSVNGAREQFGAICYRLNNETRALEVLLITTRESHRWAIPKGWPMEGRTGYQVAEQEAREEAGVSGKVSKKPFGYFTYLKSLSDGERVPCLVQVHLLKFEKALDHYREKGQREILWCSCFEAAVKVGEPELKRLFRLLHDRKSKIRP
ncbi:NUDIX hydrolase [Neorhizobium sp. P12A]|uniref:NUDIX hydrolase n=1 Tax=Neorhizobium sp. P12A TaxID=2268027 RepID=UPI001FF051B7|nr:NUDIX hydrolase [Neorhizobium sp. P12A]